MRRLIPLVAALATILAPVALTHGAVDVTPEQLEAADVVVAPGGSLTDDERARLDAAAKDLAAKEFPTKFVAVAASADAEGLNADATALRGALADKLGHIDKIDGVVLLAPRAIGLSADAFPSEITDALAAERPALQDDRVTGTINIMNRLQALDAAAALPGDTESSDKGMSPVVWVLIGAILAAGLLAIVLIRRKVSRAQAPTDAADAARAADDGAPPPELRQ